MRPSRRFLPALTLGLLFASAACTLLLDRSTDQCSNDGECAKFGQGSVCRDSVCTQPTGVGDGGPSNGEGGPGPVEAGSDATFGQDGCTPVVPSGATTNDEFINACTTSQCVPFDNCALLGACDGKYLGANPPDAGAGGSTPGPDSGATQLCSEMAAGFSVNPDHIIHMTGSSNFPPFLKTVAPVLYNDGYLVVWQTTNSCSGVDSMYAVGAPKLMKETAGRATELYDPTGVSRVCLLDADTPIDVGESDIYADTCAANLKYQPSDTNVGEYKGPTMAMVFVGKGNTNQTALSAEAAQAIYGRGGVPDPAKLPFNDPNQFYNRAASTATNQIISRGIEVDPAKWWGVDKKSASNMATALEQVPDNLSNKTLGIISTDFADSQRGNLKTFAFQSHGQTCAFWPDSTPVAEDKQNIRDGHYPLWGPIHFFTRLTGGQPSTQAGAFVLRFTATALEEDLLKGIIDSHNVPDCAMRVRRETEMGPIKQYQPNIGCGCFFDKVATGTNNCTACTTATASTDCKDPARPACNYGYCEAAPL